jgi:hypothetical protein
MSADSRRGRPMRSASEVSAPPNSGPATCESALRQPPSRDSAAPATACSGSVLPRTGSKARYGRGRRAHTVPVSSP